MITVVEKVEAELSSATLAIDDSESGQSVLEFMLVLPVLLGLAFLLIRVNTAIQMSIVDQQYARAQALYVSANGADYPRRGGPNGVIEILAGTKMNQFIVGVSENQPANSDEGNGGSNQIIASEFRIARNGNLGNNDPQTEDERRGNIRIRNTVTLCTPLLTVGGKPIRPGVGKASLSPNDVYPLSENPKQFDFCSAPQEYFL